MKCNGVNLGLTLFTTNGSSVGAILSNDTMNLNISQSSIIVTIIFIVYFT